MTSMQTLNTRGYFSWKINLIAMRYMPDEITQSDIYKQIN